MPPTPAFGMSPHTPKTAGSLYPITPIDDTRFTVSPYKEYNNRDSGYHRDSNRTARELDPYTLFVGGLETFGPGAWDEAKVERYFARFGGLESVKVVRPGKCLSSEYCASQAEGASVIDLLQQQTRTHPSRSSSSTTPSLLLVLSTKRYVILPSGIVFPSFAI
jgi:hypothetical protein